MDTQSIVDMLNAWLDKYPEEVTKLFTTYTDVGFDMATEATVVAGTDNGMGAMGVVNSILNSADMQKIGYNVSLVYKRLTKFYVVQ